MIPPSDLPRGVMYIGAHPDDETILAGGTMAMLRQYTIPTHFLCATDGRGGESGGVPEAQTPGALAAVREEELRCAGAALGITSVTLLGYEDPLIDPDGTLSGFAADEDHLVTRLADLIGGRGVDVVLTHGSNGEYGHPAHLQVHNAVMRVARERRPDLIVYGTAAVVAGFEDTLWNKSDPAHLMLDITPWIEPKHAAMLCFRTQHALFMRRRKLQTVREAIRTLETFHRHWPPVPAQEQPDDRFARVLLDAGARRAAGAAE